MGMKIVEAVCILVLSWLSIIVLYGIETHRKNPCIAAYEEMVEDGNNLFKTGIGYLIVYAACGYFNIMWLNWVCFIALTAFAVIPLLSVIIMIIATKEVITYKLSAFISQAAPLAVAILYFFTFIKNA